MRLIGSVGGDTHRERERKKERKRGGESTQTHVTEEGMIHGQGTLAHAPNFASQKLDDRRIT